MLNSEKTPFRPKSAILLSVIVLMTLTAEAKVVVNDVTQINPILVNDVVTPTTVEDVQKAISNSKGKISIGGGRYSMGGQTATENGVQIDMRKMNKVINIDVPNKKITVQAGIRWRDIQDAIDPHNLSIKIMQTYSNFTVGGSLSVNVHGRYIGQGPLIRSVDSIKVVLADGKVVVASPQENSDIFFATIGGYGGIGVIVEATLQLADNVKVERQVKKMPASEYNKFFVSEIRDNPKVIFHNGDIYPPEFSEVSAVSWVETDKELTVKDRMIPRNQKYTFQPGAISAMTSMPLGRKLREDVVDPLLYRGEMVVWRNHEASYDVAELEPASRRNSTFVLQEYFVPVEKFDEFIPKMRSVFKKYDVAVFNVSIRHALPDVGSLLAWAPQEVFAFVVYYKQGTKPEDKEEVGRWTREMITEVLSVGGRYYLPYQIHATDDQFHRAYPRYNEYFEMKKKYDPDYRFTNKLWDRYYVSVPDRINLEITKIKNYNRREDQTFLGLPEWYIVFNGDEYAAFLKKNKPSEFNYFKSIIEFWNLKTQVKQIIKAKYPTNMGYEVMLWVIGSSYSIELALKGLYENTIGWFTEAISSPELTQEDKLMQRFHQEYADYVHIYPWYEFSFYERLKIFLAEAPKDEGNKIRKIERRIFFTVEYLIKAAYAQVIKWGTQMSYEPEPAIIYGVISDPENQIGQFAQVKVLQTSENIKLVEMPRYDEFRKLTEQLTNTQIKFIEIAGNRKIFLTALGSINNDQAFDSGEVLGLSNVPTDTQQKRLLLLASETSLVDLVKALKEKNYSVEHIFDY